MVSAAISIDLNESVANDAAEKTKAGKTKYEKCFEIERNALRFM